MGHIINHIEPQIFPEITTVMIDERECILVRFEGYNTPYFAYDIARIRVADEDRTMSQPEILKYLQQKNGVEDAWERRVSDITISAVPEENVCNYIERSKAAGRIAFEFTDKAAALNKLSLTSGEYLLNAGMVLFSSSIYAELQMAVFAGTERLTFLDIRRERGTIFELVSLAEKYIVSNIHWHVVFDGTLQRKEIPEIPIDAIREALINSFCHKDYGACQSNEVAIYKDRVEIYNPGTFPAGFLPDDFIRGNERPVRRNPLIASVLYYSKDVESFGTGLKRIADACHEAHCRFEFKILKSGFVVIFYRNIQDTSNNIQDSIQDSGCHNVFQATGSDCEATKKKIWMLCSQPRSRDELMEFCGFKNRAYFTTTFLKPMLQSGEIIMTIPDKPSSKNQKYIRVEEI